MILIYITPILVSFAGTTTGGAAPIEPVGLGFGGTPTPGAVSFSNAGVDVGAIAVPAEPRFAGRSAMNDAFGGKFGNADVFHWE